YDPGTGLYYYGARYYDVRLMHFVSADRTVQDFTDPQFLNRYAYVRNNPLNRVDPTGLSSVVITVNRTTETEKSTTGELWVNGRQVGYTLERPWRDNRNNESRIPAGTYFAQIHWSNKLGYTVLELKRVEHRSEVLIHIGNIPDDTIGCILPGETLGKDFVGKSSAALGEIHYDVFNTLNADFATGEGTDIIVDVRDPRRDETVNSGEDAFTTSPIERSETGSDTTVVSDADSDTTEVVEEPDF
ncbi:MAG: DUF5675 family protein, partial [Pseudomonadota bacterium]